MDRRRIPRGPAEWGRLLFEPEWVATDRFTGENKGGFGMMLALMILGPFIVTVPNILFPIPLGPQLIFEIALGVLLIVLGVGHYIINNKQMPFRVYEAGFTLNEVEWRKGFHMEEELVPWDRLRSVELEEREPKERGPMGQTLRNLVLRYDDAAGGKAMLKVDPTEVGDLLGMMLALHDIVPDKLGEGFEPYVGTGSGDRVVSVPKGLSLLRKPSYVVIYNAIGMIVFFGVLGGAALGQGYSFIPRVIVPSGAAFALITGLVLAMAFGDKEPFLIVVNIDAQVRGDSIIYPRPWVFLLVLAIRPALPVGSVRKVVKCLDPISFGHEASIATSSDVGVRVPYGVFEMLEGRTDFRREGRVLLNRRPAPESDIPIARTSWPRVLLLWLVLLGIMFGTTLVNVMTNGGLDGFVKFLFIIFPVLLAPLLGVLILSTFHSGWRYPRQQKLEKGLEILPDVLRVPKAPKGMREIPREDVIKIRTYSQYMTRGIHLETKRGTLDLSLALGSKLRKAGYEVIDEPDLIQRELSAGEGMGDRDGY